MIACLDVDYKENEAHVACLLFENWTDEEPQSIITSKISDIEEYVPGQFYKRELPCILAVLEKVEQSLEVIVIDGYVWLKNEESPGLGAYLYRHLKETIPVIGVAKNKFKDDRGCSGKVVRGQSAKPLYITVAGLPLEEAMSYIQNMHGTYRIPTLLKLVDQSCRNWDLSQKGSE